MTELVRRSPRGAPVVAGGLISTFFGLFHLAFWRVFDWSVALAPLAPLDRAVMQVLNVHVAYTILFVGYLSLFHSGELVGTRLGRTLSFFVAGFWVLRAVNEVVFFPNPPLPSAMLLATFVGTGLLYAIPACTRARTGAEP
ncbi:MAG: hypothetical protein JW940_23105 [Polyangiaceae bacterium]|nr:hypothetical protein [Polyangiaceae bacterium]